MEHETFSDGAAALADKMRDLADQVGALANQAVQEAVVQAPVPVAGMTEAVAGGETFLSFFTAFVLACFIGFYVVWSVTPALHSPLMAVTNAISSVIIVGGLIAASQAGAEGFPKLMGILAVTLASVNIFGGFIVTQRMLAMFKKKKK